MPTISMFYGIVIRALIHKDELMANWQLAKNSETLYNINPLN